MPLLDCPECGSKISSSAKSCPSCGSKRPRWRWWIVAPIAAFAGMLLLGTIVGSSPDAQERAHERAVIRQCWSSYEQKSLTPAEKRFVAGACESMEEKFVQKHGRRP
jgi:hypothetical protein